MINVVAAARTGFFTTLGLLPTADRAPKTIRRPVRLRTALTAGFLAACGGLLAVIARRGYTIYG